MIVNKLDDVAQFTGKSLRTVQRWRRLGMPELPGRKYDLGAITAWLRAGKRRGNEAERRQIQSMIYQGASKIQAGLNEIAAALLLAGQIEPDDLLQIARAAVHELWGKSDEKSV